MMNGWRRTFVALLVLALLGWVYSPLFVGGPLGPDYAVLASASRLVHPELGGAAVQRGFERFFEAPGTEGRPLAALSLAASAWLWTDAGVWSRSGLAALRFENLLLFLACALLLARFVLRLVLPWTGSEQARAAGAAAGALVLFYPLSVPAVAAPGARSLLIGGLLAAATAQAFLRGRQDRSYTWVFLAGGLAFACSLASEVALLLPAGLAVTEYVSAHRYRPRLVRLRTSLTTLVIFGACVALEPLLRAGLAFEAQPTGISRSVAAFSGLQTGLHSILVAFERLGFSILPVNAASRGATGYIIGVGLLLVPLQPALQAARSAPRLWAGVLASWAVLIAVAVLYRADVRVHPTDLSGAETLLPASVVMAAGLGLASTALTGRRRFFVPAAAVFVASLLSRSEASCIRRAAREGAEVQRELFATAAEYGSERPILVVDPPGNVLGHPATVQQMEWMLDPAVGGSGPPAERAWARGIEAAGFRVLARQSELAMLREHGLAVVLPAALLQGVPEDDESRRVHVSIPPPRGQEGPRVWREEGRSSTLDFEPLSVHGLRVVARSGTRVYEPPEMAWDAVQGEERDGRLTGVWLAGEDGPVAFFEPMRSWRWLFAERVQRIWFEGELALIVQARALEQLPSVPGVTRPEVRGDDWVFRPEWDALPEPRPGELAFTLELFDLDSFEHLAIPGLRRGEELSFADAEDFASGLWREGGLLCWSVDARVGDTTVARSSGR